MRARYTAVLLCATLGLSTTALAESSAVENCKKAWQQSSAYQSCVKSDTVITASGTHCNIEAICLNMCTWKKLTDMNWVTLEEVRNLQNCDGQLAHSDKECKIDLGNRCSGDN